MCISQSADGEVYVTSWYLDSVAAGWKAIIMGDYEAVFPLFENHKFFLFRQIYHPVFVKDISIYTTENTTEKKVSFESYCRNYINRLPVFYLLLRDSISGLGSEPTQVLDKQVLDLSQRELVRDKKSVTSLAKTEENVFRISAGLDKKQYLDFVKNHIYSRLDKGSMYLERLGHLIESALRQESGYLYGLYYDNQLIAVRFLIHYKDRIYFIQNASGPLSRKNNGMLHLNHQIIQEWREKAGWIDFMGSNLPNVAAFNRKFAVTERKYYKMEYKSGILGFLNKLKHGK